MRAHRRFVIMTFMVAAALLGLYGLVVKYCYLATDSGTELQARWDKECYDKKEAYARRVGSPKLIFAGGSATMFGIRAEDVERALGIPAVNFGVDASLQLDYIIYKTKQIASNGDIVVLPLEYYHFFNATKSPSPIKIRYLLNYDKEYYLKTQPVGPIIRHAFSISIADILKSLDAQVVVRNMEPLAGKAAYTTALNKNGDYMENFGISTLFEKRMRDVTAKGLVYMSEEPIGDIPGALPLADFKTWCAKHGVELYVTYANTVYFDEFAEDRYKTHLKRLEARLADTGLKTIGAPYDYFFPKELFYDTAYHMNADGVTKRTKRLIEQLKQLGIGKARRPDR